MAATGTAICVDWGTSNLRAWRLEAEGRVGARREAPQGILKVAGGDFAGALAALIGDWREADPGAPVLMAGMIGSRQGWHEAPYVPCPAGLAKLAAAIRPVPGAPGVFIVPGVHLAEAGRHDVMRGEEVQVFGALALTCASAPAPESGPGPGPRPLCLPGTHSKWAEVADGRLVRFATAMTGEVFAVLAEHSILGRLMRGRAADPAAFRAGVARSGEAGGLLHHLFGVRAAGLFEAVPATGLSAYLSGLLIGHELRALQPPAPAGPAPLDGPPALLVAGGELAEAYGAAFEALGRPYESVDAEAASLAGLRALLEAMPDAQ